MAGESTPPPDAVTGEKQQQTPSSGGAGAGAGAAAVAGGGDGVGVMGGEGKGGDSVLSTMSRVGCAAKVVQIGRVANSDSFKVMEGCCCCYLLSLCCCCCCDGSLPLFFVVVLFLLPVFLSSVSNRRDSSSWSRFCCRHVASFVSLLPDASSFGAVTAAIPSACSRYGSYLRSTFFSGSLLSGLPSLSLSLSL